MTINYFIHSLHLVNGNNILIVKEFLTHIDYASEEKWKENINRVFLENEELSNIFMKRFHLTFLYGEEEQEFVSTRFYLNIAYKARLETDYPGEENKKKREILQKLAEFDPEEDFLLAVYFTEHPLQENLSRMLIRI